MTENVSTPPPPQVQLEPIKKGQEDLNIDAYQKIFDKCLVAAEDLVDKRLMAGNSGEQRKMVLDVARTIFDRFHSDQAAIKQSKQQADAMMQGLTHLLEGRR